MSGLSTKNYKPRATGSLSHFMSNVFCAVLKTAPFSVNCSNSCNQMIKIVRVRNICAKIADFKATYSVAF